MTECVEGTDVSTVTSTHRGGGEDLKLITRDIGDKSFIVDFPLGPSCKP